MEQQMKHLISEILDRYESNRDTVRIDRLPQPNREVVAEIIDTMGNILFPGYFETKQLSREMAEYYVGSLIEEVYYKLSKQIVRAYRCCSELNEQSYQELNHRADEICMRFLKRIPHIQDLLATDVQAAYDGDPAAFSIDEIIYSYPGLHAIMVYRIAHELFLLEVPLIPRIMTEHAHSVTGIDIHPGATIGKYFFIDHGTGVVIGETSVIGEHVKIYQGVTLGGLSTSGGQSMRGLRRHPTIEDNVTIYSGASILGGDTVIGEGSVIGGNSFITSGIPANSRIISRTQYVDFMTSDPII